MKQWSTPPVLQNRGINETTGKIGSTHISKLHQTELQKHETQVLNKEKEIKPWETKSADKVQLWRKQTTAHAYHVIASRGHLLQAWGSSHVGPALTGNTWSL